MLARIPVLRAHRIRLLHRKGRLGRVAEAVRIAQAGRYLGSLRRLDVAPRYKSPRIVHDDGLRHARSGRSHDVGRPRRRPPSERTSQTNFLRLYATRSRICPRANLSDIWSVTARWLSSLALICFQLSGNSTQYE